MTPEEELVVVCVADYIDAESGDIGDVLRREIDWSGAIRTAYRHGVIPLVYQQVAERDHVPAAVCTTLRDVTAEITRGNLHLTKALFESLDALEQRGVPALPHKGPVLAEILYGDVSRRHFSDVDIIVPEDTVEEACEALVDSGFELPEDDSRRGAREHPDEYHHRFHHERRGVAVELHWGVAPSTFTACPSSATLCEWAEPRTVMGRTVRWLPTEVLLPLLCVHGTKHRWERLEWVCDVSLLVAREDFDWKRVLTLADDFKCRRMLRVGLRVGQTLLDLPLPRTVRQEIQADETVTTFADEYADRLFSQRGFGPAESVLHQARIQDGLVRQLRYLVDVTLIPRPRDRDLISLPDQLSGLYRIIRPLRLAGIVGRRAWR